MADPPRPPTFLEGLYDYYNSPKFSDVKIQVNHYGGGHVYSEVYDHKIVLAAGSSVFRDYFENHDLGDGKSGYTVSSKEIYQTSEGLTTTMLQYLYGMNEFGDDSEQDWKELCDAADGFGIPSLREHATNKLEAYLQGLLESSESGREFDLFIEEVRDLLQTTDEKSAATEVMARLTYKHFSELRKHERFDNLTDDYLWFSRAMLDYAAREGMSGPA